jgi:hypothetical protein
MTAAPQGLDTKEKGSPNPQTVVLDMYLCDALYKGVVNVKKGELYPTHIAKAEVEEALVARTSKIIRMRRGATQVGHFIIGCPNPEI